MSQRTEANTALTAMKAGVPALRHLSHSERIQYLLWLTIGGGGGGGGVASQVSLLDNLGAAVSAANPLNVQIPAATPINTVNADVVASLANVITAINNKQTRILDEVGVAFSAGNPLPVELQGAASGLTQTELQAAFTAGTPLQVAIDNLATLLDANQYKLVDDLGNPFTDTNRLEVATRLLDENNNEYTDTNKVDVTANLVDGANAQYTGTNRFPVDSDQAVYNTIDEEVLDIDATVQSLDPVKVAAADRADIQYSGRAFVSWGPTPTPNNGANFSRRDMRDRESTIIRGQVDMLSFRYTRQVNDALGHVYYSVRT